MAKPTEIVEIKLDTQQLETFVSRLEEAVAIFKELRKKATPTVFKKGKFYASNNGFTILCTGDYDPLLYTVPGVIVLSANLSYFIGQYCEAWNARIFEKYGEVDVNIEINDRNTK